MKIAGINNVVFNQPIKDKKHKTSNISFGSGGFLNVAGSIMENIDKQGYFLSFLIQDGLGMTAPRVGTGFFRDRKETGEFNFKEAKEVFLREALSGPYMMVVAPAMLFLTGFFCKSTNTNTRLIKIIGNNMKTMIKEPAFDKTIQKDSAKFQKEFYKYNISKFYKETVPNDKDAEKTVEFILKEFDNLNAKKSKTQAGALDAIISKVNDKIIETSTDMDKLCRMNINVNGKEKTFKTKDVILAIRDYGNDAIKNNKNAASIDEKAAENIKNNFATKRLLLNVANIAATLGGLSVIPKIYARSKVAPGAQHLLKAQEEAKKQNDNKQQEISFKGRGINSGGVFAKIGKLLTKTVPDWIQREFEYDGINFTKSLMASLALFGLLLPRGKKAYDRALVDENGKKDLSELNEILLRDTISSLGVVYTVPILTKCFVKGCEENTGFVLTNRASKNKNSFKKFLDVINPYSELRVFENAELKALYNNIDTKDKMLNLCKYISEKGGDLEKILSKSVNANLMFNDKTFTLESIKNLNKNAKNEKITEFIKGLDKDKADELIAKVMKDAGKIEKSAITKFARGLYSVPGFITTVIISPVILGCLVPLLTYSNTRKAHAKMNIKIDNNTDKSQTA